MNVYVFIIHRLLIINALQNLGEFDMRATKTNLMTLWVLILLVLPFAAMPVSSAWTAGDEAAILGHTFTEEYWTNSSIRVEAADGTNSSFTASYVHVGEFSSFLIAFNNANTTDGKKFILPYQLFGMYFKTPEDKEVFIGAIFAFLLVHVDNKTFADNKLPDIGHDNASYVVPLASDNTWPAYKPSVVPIPATKIGENHYRFGMHYYNLTCRVVDSTKGFVGTYLLPLVTVLVSELTIQYDITIDETGQVHAETLYTLGQVKKLRILIFDVPPADFIDESFEVSAVHYLSIFTSKYNVTKATSGNTIALPTSTALLNEDISIKVGDDNERAFDIGLGRQYSLINESTNPWSTVSDDENALNCLLGARYSDLLLVAWQAPLSAFLLANMAYGLSTQIRSMYTSVGDLASHASTAFHNSNWWYAVTFPTWNGLRVQQDPVYTAYTNLAVENNGGGVVLLLLIAVGVLAVVYIIRRRR
jgi:hypothetical protein